MDPNEGRDTFWGRDAAYYKGNQAVAGKTAEILSKALPGLKINPVITNTDTFSLLHNTPSEGAYNVTYDLVGTEDATAAKIASELLITLSKAINNFVDRMKLNEAGKYPKSRITNIEHGNNMVIKLPVTHLILYPYIAESIAANRNLVNALRKNAEVKAALAPIRDALSAAGRTSHSSNIGRRDPKDRRTSPPSSHSL